MMLTWNVNVTVRVPEEGIWHGARFLTLYILITTGLMAVEAVRLF